MKNGKLVLILMAFALCLAVPARGAMLVENVSVAPTTASSLDFNFAQFDPSLGTLNSVDLVLTPTVGVIGYQIYNISAPQQVASVEVTDPHGTLTGSGLSAAWSSPESQERDSFTAGSGLSTGALAFSSFVTTPSSVTVGPAGFAGPGTHDLILNATDVATVTGTASPSLFYGYFENVGGNLVVDYHYTPAPESGMMTGATGLLALGLVLLTRCFRSSQAAGLRSSRRDARE
jgi:hypothetical protein